ncbi:MAG TPA: NFACT RNA binding domain-containing protein, partial [Myxococcaceae bacterium]|nr:NFACT RNA binding domain-containing protein [Myxococcaceae bacterium]
MARPLTNPMPLRPSEIAQVVPELAAGLTGAFVQKVYLPQANLCFLDLRQVGRSVRLCLSAEPEGGRVSVAEDRPPSPPQALPLQQRLRNLLVGARLDALGLGEDPHEVRLDFSGSTGRWRLAVVLSGGRAGLSLRAGEEEPPATPPEPKGDSAAPPRFEPLSDAPFPWAQGAERWGKAQQTHSLRETARRQKVNPLKARLKKLRRTMEKVRGEASRGPQAEQHRRFGELLSQNAFRVPRGAPSVRLTEYSESGARQVEVPIRPGHGAREEADWNFRQYRRLLRGAGMAAERLRSLETEAAELERAMAVASEEDQAPGREGEVASGRPLPAVTRARKPPEASPYKEYRGSHGEAIWVGKGGRDNDALTFEIARPRDVWLHVRGVPGAHVVIPWRTAAALPQELLIDAAHLAVHYSKVKGEPRAEVSHTRVKHVRKAKGAAPGSVTY